MNDTSSAAPSARTEACSSVSPATSYVTASCSDRHSGEAYSRCPMSMYSRPPIQQKTPIPRRLLVIAVMQIDHPRLLLFEEMILHPCRPRIRRRLPLPPRHEAPIFRFDPDDAIHSEESSAANSRVSTRPPSPVLHKRNTSPYHASSPSPWLGRPAQVPPRPVFHRNRSSYLPCASTRPLVLSPLVPELNRDARGSAAELPTPGVSAGGLPPDTRPSNLRSFATTPS